MTFENLVSIIADTNMGEEWDLKSSTYTFGFRCLRLFDDKIIAFGGYGTHISTWNVEHSSPEDIANGIVEHIKQYDSDVNEYVTLEECEMV
jgi:hypothetical protein